jgi:hypothetical protein
MERALEVAIMKRTQTVARLTSPTRHESSVHLDMLRDAPRDKELEETSFEMLRSKDQTAVVVGVVGGVTVGGEQNNTTWHGKT